MVEVERLGEAEAGDSSTDKLGLEEEEMKRLC